jgi:hypothetical protein
VCIIDEDNDVDVGGPNIIQDERFWCESKYSGSTTTLKVHSKQANLPLLQLYPMAGGSGKVESITPPLLNAPGGKTYKDPYSETSLKFAGTKRFVLRSYTNWPWYLRAANRGFIKPDKRHTGAGFRWARTYFPKP